MLRARVNRFAKRHPYDETIDLLLRSQTRPFGCKAIDSNKYTGPACAHKLVLRRGVEKSSTVGRINNVVHLWCPQLRLSSERSARSTVMIMMYLLNSPSSDLHKKTILYSRIVVWGSKLRLTRMVSRSQVRIGQKKKLEACP